MKRLVGVMALAICLGACDTGPDGPGDLTGSVGAGTQDLGGVVFEVVGAGIEGFSGAGGSRVFWAQQENPVVFRVIVVSENGGDMRFSATVTDRGGRMPRATVVSAVDTENRPVPVTEAMEVRFVR